MTASVSVVPRQAVPSRGMKIVWEEPPPVGRATANPYRDFTAALRERPNQWAVMKEFPRQHAKRGWSLATRINRGQGTSWEGRHFEAVARTVGDVVKVYVRFKSVTEVSA